MTFTVERVLNVPTESVLVMGVGDDGRRAAERAIAARQHGFVDVTNEPSNKSPNLCVVLGDLRHVTAADVCAHAARKTLSIAVVVGARELPKSLRREFGAVLCSCTGDTSLERSANAVLSFIAPTRLGISVDDMYRVFDRRGDDLHIVASGTADGVETACRRLSARALAVPTTPHEGILLLELPAWSGQREMQQGILAMAKSVPHRLLTPAISIREVGYRVSALL